MRIDRLVMLAAAGSVFLTGAASAHEEGGQRDRALVVNAHAQDERQQTTQRPVQGATVGVYTRTLASSPPVPIFLAQAVTDASGRARLEYASGTPGTFRVLATGPRAEVRRGAVSGERGGLLDLALGAVTFVDTTAETATAVGTGELYFARRWFGFFWLPVLAERVRYEKVARFTGEAGTALMIQDTGHRALTWAHRELRATSHVAELTRVTYAHPVSGFDGDLQGATQNQVAIGRTGPLQPELVMLGLGQVLVRRALHRQLLPAELASANIADVYAEGRRGTTHAVTATAQGMALWLATLMGDALGRRDEAFLRLTVDAAGTEIISAFGGDRHAGAGLIAPAGLGQARAEYAALGQHSVQNVFCALWDLTDEADGDTDGVVAGASDQVDGRARGGADQLLADLHRVHHELPVGTSTLSLQEAWSRALRARYGVAGAQALRLNGVSVRD